MAQLQFTFDTGNVPLSRINDSLALEFGYQSIIRDPIQGDIPNPETKAQFNKRKIKEFIIDAVKNQDIRTARTTADAGVTPINLT